MAASLDVGTSCKTPRQAKAGSDNGRRQGQAGRAVQYLSSKVAAIDADNATIVLESGYRIQADLVLGADGIYVRKHEEPCLSSTESKHSPKQESQFRGGPSSSLDLERLLSDSLSPRRMLLQIPRPSSYFKTTTSYAFGMDVIDALLCIRARTTSC